MRANPARCLGLITILAILIPNRLYSASVTNQPSPAVSIEKTNVVETDKRPLSPPLVVPTQTRIVYKPPLRGAPAVRIDGGSRGSGVSLICLTVLAPDHTGLTCLLN